ncbi:DUF4913 domain-containing protein [Embleya sp. NBC_00896]|uniref:DUF4913 domain-containing protein n=1 Tax=Embleya sp. NBC_00896 TaxID=2975961 RepID=UPI00386E61E8|nr:DUF4913 domain-containing protein [Embleya sp. NBC_00896]
MSGDEVENPWLDGQEDDWPEPEPAYPEGGPGYPEGGPGYGDAPSEDEPFIEEENPDDAMPDLVFGSVDEFVTDYLAQVIRRRINRATAIWCPEWWQHPEAIARIASLWRAFEFLRLDAALGMSTWWLHHADPHLRALMDPDYGPFAICDPRDGHAERPLEPLVLVPSPPEMWDHPAFSLAAAEREHAEAAAGAPPPPTAGRPKEKTLGSNLGA